MNSSWDPQIALVVAAVGLLLIGLIYFFGRPGRESQGKRLFSRGPAPRREPSLSGVEGGLSTEEIEEELDALERVLAGDGPDRNSSERSAGAGSIGGRSDSSPDFEKIVSLFVAAREGSTIHGADLVVAAEKVGLTFGAMSIFHRAPDGGGSKEPIFSVANMVKPGTFDLRHLERVETPGLSFFMTLPGPMSGLDAWDAMLPAAQRMAELLNGLVLDDQRNALGRQRIAHIRDDLRAFDRRHEQTAGKPW